MSAPFDPGPGWREVTGEEVRDGVEYLRFGYRNAIPRMWVREVPVPPLPTDPYTVIRVTWDDHVDSPDRTATLDNNVRWYTPSGRGYWVGELAALITGFVVLAEPRVVTAKAVLDRVRELRDGDGYMAGSRLDRVAREFGVDP